MNEAARLQRNTDRLAECHPAFAQRLRQAIRLLEAQGFRPRIQDGWRSKEDQLAAFNSGNSTVTFGFHNATFGDGRKASLACDVLDDDNPLQPPVRYLLALAIAAGDAGLRTGVLWRKRETDPPLTAAAEAIRNRNINAAVPVGWDPCHAEMTGITLAQAEAGDFSSLPAA